jgi:hypothetical protein
MYNIAGVQKLKAGCNTTHLERMAVSLFEIIHNNATSTYKFFPVDLWMVSEICSNMPEFIER